MLYFNEIDTLKERVYDRPYMNDELEYSYIMDKSNYKPLGQRWRPFFIMPFFAKKGDFSKKPSNR
jgi:hypothetical protein